MGEKENNSNLNESLVTRWLRNAVLGATMADLPAMMTASGWRQNEKGDYVLDLQNDPHVKLLRDNLAAEGAGVMLGEFGIPAVYGLYNLGLRGLGKAGSNYARAKLISREMQNASTSNHTYPLNVGWGPKQTIKVTHATDSLEPLQLFFDQRWDVTNEGANPFGVWYLGKWGLPRTAATNSLPGKAEKAAKARKIFEDRKYKLTGEVTLDKPLITVGEVPDRSVLSYDAEKMGADGIIYNNVYDNGYDNNQVILSHKLHVPSNKKGSKIHIKKKNRGKFTEYCGGEVTDECILKAKKSKNPKLRKRATFAANARKWKHLTGGRLDIKGLMNDPEFKKNHNLYINPKNISIANDSLIGRNANNALIGSVLTLIISESGGETKPHGNGAYGLIGWRGARAKGLPKDLPGLLHHLMKGLFENHKDWSDGGPGMNIGTGKEMLQFFKDGAYNNYRKATNAVMNGYVRPPEDLKAKRHTLVLIVKRYIK